MASALRSLRDRNMRVIGQVILMIRLGARPSRTNLTLRLSGVGWVYNPALLTQYNLMLG